MKMNHMVQVTRNKYISNCNFWRPYSKLASRLNEGMYKIFCQNLVCVIKAERNCICLVDKNAFVYEPLEIGRYSQ